MVCEKEEATLLSVKRLFVPLVLFMFILLVLSHLWGLLSIN